MSSTHSPHTHFSVEGSSFYLCNVCNENSHYSKNTNRCSICNKNMANLWIKLDNSHYCCNCVTEEMVTETMTDAGVVKTSTALAWGIVVATQRDTTILDSWKRVLNRAIARGKLEHDEYKAYSGKRKRKAFEKNYEAVKKWIPNMQQEEGERLAKRFRTELPKCNSVLEFIDTLIEESQDK